MATLLLIVIYIGYVGLGVPDSLLGAAWPAIYEDFQIPTYFASFITIVTSLCTFVSSLNSAKLIKRFGTGNLAAVSTTLTALSLFGISFTGHWAFLILLAIPLGLGAGAIDSALNGYVALHYNAKQMNFLHCCYGIGVAVSPYLLSIVLSAVGNWQGGYRAVSFLQMGIAAVLIISLPLWKRIKKSDPTEEEQKLIPLKEIVKIKGIFPVWTMFLASCSIEACCTTWGSTYLAEHLKFPVDSAAGTITVYFVGLALGRIISGLLSDKFSPKRLMQIGLLVMGCGIVSFLLPLGAVSGTIGLFLTGLGVGPIYPNLMHITPIIFHRDIAQSIMGTHMAVAFIGVTLAPPFFGWIANLLGQGIFPIFIGLLLIALVTAIIKLSSYLKESAN